MKTLKIYIILLCTVTTITSCTSTSSLYDHYTNTETIEIKLQTLSLMDKSDTAFSSHENEVIALKNDLQKMLIYETGKGKNEITQKMWEVLNNDNKLVLSYLALWKQKGSLNAAFIEEAKPQIEEAFNILIQYEEKKDPTNENAVTNFISNL
ncbi:hypothetical protein [uncultured Dokdonia sp.]|uniref:hypothetical protein n=1 Tax=uncultured Dokdonia sp. TaxID=575653 RepID=UPI00261B0DEB|nr:hypothetical protein [uncultured Dokdonia sp.]